MALRLIITQGPRQGETLQFPQGSTVRIGRVVRGNSLAIKDSGISSKHLAVEPDSGKWLLRDLDSSNGTFLNGEPVDPSVAVEIRSGDVVKLGEQTSISVEIAGAAEPTPPRRNPARRARVSRCKVEEGGSPEIEIVEGDERNRGSKRSGNEGVAAAGMVKRTSTRRTRRGKNEENAVSGSVLGKIPENSELEGGKEKVEIAKKAKPNTRRRKNLQQNPIDAVEESAAEADVRVDQAVDLIENVNENGNACGAAESSAAFEKAGGSGGSKESLDGVGEELDLDLEKMKLGEWFDCLEAGFRKQIVEATEEMIKGMRSKAEQVREYAAQQKNEKARVAVV